jgi:acyl-CoA thioester hydrolase
MTGAPVVFEKRIEIRWRDLDAFGHVNNAVYLTYLEEARDAWLAGMVPEGRSTWDYVIVRVAIDYRRELREEDDFVVVSCRLRRLGRSSIVTQEEVRKLDGELSAEAEAVMVARDAESQRSRPLTPEELEAFGRLAGA